MRKDDTSQDKRVMTWTVVLSLCLLAVGIGVLIQALSHSTKMPGNLAAAEYGYEFPQESVARPVTLAQTPTIEETQTKQEKEEPDVQTNAEPAAHPQEAIQPVFSYPVQGEIVLAYSVDSAIFDPTLEQYRTNSSICFSADTGTKVCAAADGTVEEIMEDVKSGYTIVLKDEGGWLTTYSQLNGEIPVKVGDVVTKGQVIGVVANPSRYGAALGSHLDFAIERDGKTVNPQEVLRGE